MLDTQGYKYTLRSSSTVKMFAQTRLNITFYAHRLSFITETECVYCAVRAESSNVIQAKLSCIMPSPFIACGNCLDKCALRKYHEWNFFSLRTLLPRAPIFRLIVSRLQQPDKCCCNDLWTCHGRTVQCCSRWLPLFVIGTVLTVTSGWLSS